MKFGKLKIFFCISILLLSVNTVSFLITARNNQKEQINSITEAKIIVEKKLKSEAQVFEKIDASVILSQLKSTGKCVLPLTDRKVTLNLRERTYNLDSSEEIYFYNGFVENYENSEVYLTLDNYRISGIIEIPIVKKGIQSYSISHISDYINPKINEKSAIHIIRHANKIENTGYDQVTNNFFTLTKNDLPKLQNDPDCNCSENSGTEQENKLAPTIHSKISSISTSNYYAKVKIYADYYYYQHYGDHNWYYMDEVNYVIGKWDNTGQQNADMQISVKSTDVWTSTSEGGSCYSATSMSDLHSKFSSWGNSQSIFGTWTGTEWNGDTDFALLMTGKNWASYLGMANYKGAGIYKSGSSKYSICEIWPGLFTEIVSWGISHEWGHLFAAHHEDGPAGHRAWAWCDLGRIWGICFGYRQTNMWHTYIFAQCTVGTFSKNNVDGAGTDNNNVYYIRQWRDSYLRS